MIEIKTNDRQYLTVPESQIRSIREVDAGYEITLTGSTIVTFFEPVERKVIASGLELWQPVEIGDGQVEWAIEPLAGLLVEHYVLSGEAAVVGVVPVGGFSNDCAGGVLVDRARRLARPVNDSSACWSSDLASVLSDVLGRPVKRNDVPDLALAA